MYQNLISHFAAKDCHSNQNHGHIVFNIWDIAGNHPEACAEYLKDSDAAIIMFDPAQKPSFEDVVIWHRMLHYLQDLPAKGYS